MKYYKLILFILVVLTAMCLFSHKEGFVDNSETIKYTAIIVEPREHKALEFVLKNFMDNLNDEWQFIIFHGNKNKEYVEKIIDNNFKDKTHKIKLVDLKVDNLTIPDYNKLFFTKEFYDNIPTEIFLVFQTDTMLFKENSHKLNNFLKYDYVGAPFIEAEWNKDTDKIGNGGLSIRHKSKMLEILDKCKIDDNIPEDVYFGALFCKNVNVKKPSYEAAKEFSVEQVYFDNPIGIHKPWIFNHFSQLTDKYNDLKTLETLNR